MRERTLWQNEIGGRYSVLVMRKAAGRMIGASIVFVMTACSADSRRDAGTDAGAAFDAGCAERVEAAISATLSRVCSDQDGGPSPAVIFRLRNATDADLWVATTRWIGFLCQPTTFLGTCSGHGLGAQTIQSELCLYPLRRLEPDASVDLEPYNLVANLQLDACPARAIGRWRRRVAAPVNQPSAVR